jgi:hypothetical protein
MGCVGYRGYFDREGGRGAGRAALQAEGLGGQRLRRAGLQHLGWSNWVGGDPLLNTFVQLARSRSLARLIFHELAHQVAYAADDTTFNESFATRCAARPHREGDRGRVGQAVGGRQGQAQEVGRGCAAFGLAGGLKLPTPMCPSSSKARRPGHAELGSRTRFFSGAQAGAGPADIRQLCLTR